MLKICCSNFHKEVHFVVYPQNLNRGLCKTDHEFLGKVLQSLHQHTLSNLGVGLVVTNIAHDWATNISCKGPTNKMHLIKKLIKNLTKNKIFLQVPKSSCHQCLIPTDPETVVCVIDVSCNQQGTSIARQWLPLLLPSGYDLVMRSSCQWVAIYTTMYTLLPLGS